MPIVSDHRGTRADRGPDIGVSAFLAHPRFILEPDFNRDGPLREPAVRL